MPSVVGGIMGTSDLVLFMLAVLMKQLQSPPAMYNPCPLSALEPTQLCPGPTSRPPHPGPTY
eukprot:14486384-Ditylum_brightwellii.AAC.1